jgi:hypothetical protein
MKGADGRRDDGTMKRRYSVMRIICTEMKSKFQAMGWRYEMKRQRRMNARGR